MQNHMNMSFESRSTKGSLGKGQSRISSLVCENTEEHLIECLMAPARGLAGIDTCQKYTTNNNESINRVIKEFTGHKKREWPVFHMRMKELIDSQDQEFQKAIFGQGEYNIHPTYRHLAVSLFSFLL